jgi:hypothetical protein
MFPDVMCEAPFEHVPRSGSISKPGVADRLVRRSEAKTEGRLPLETATPHGMSNPIGVLQ